MKFTRPPEKGWTPTSPASAPLGRRGREELGVNLLLGGHYATETFGVKAAADLSERFKIPGNFIDHPSGL